MEKVREIRQTSRTMSEKKLEINRAVRKSVEKSQKIRQTVRKLADKKPGTSRAARNPAA